MENLAKNDYCSQFTESNKQQDLVDLKSQLNQVEAGMKFEFKLIVPVYILQILTDKDLVTESSWRWNGVWV